MAAAKELIAFDHIALATSAIANAPALLVGELGGASGYGGPNAEFSFFHWDYEGGGRIEVLEPHGKPGGFVHRFLDSRGPGIHHTTFKVSDIEETCARAKGLGYTIVGFNNSDPGWKEAFLHPKQALGVVVQFAEEGEHDDEEHEERHPITVPGEPENPPASVSIVGLRMRSGNRDAVVRQWSGVLQGELSESASELVFTWPTSSMRVSVSLEEGAEDVSECIEVRSDRDLNLPAGPHPELGARFVQIP